MAKQQGDGPLHVALLMHIMDIEGLEAVDGNGGSVIGELVQLRLLLPPVEAVLPVVRQSLHIRKRSSVIPPRVVQLVGEIGVVEFRG